MNHLLQPKKYKSLMTDTGSLAIMDKTIHFFENRMGKTKLTENYWSRIWYREFLDFLKKEQIFYKLLTPNANACAAYAVFETAFQTPRWEALAAIGARVQRPLWASTSTKDPAYPDVYYVEALVGPRTVNTLPPATFDAYRDHGQPAVRIVEGVARATGQLRALADAGIDLAGVTTALEIEGVRSFAKSYTDLLAGIEAKAGALSG